MAYSFANFCPGCGVASEVFVDESTPPEGPTGFHYQCPQCKGSVSHTASFFINVLAIPSDGTIARLDVKPIKQVRDAEAANCRMPVIPFSIFSRRITPVAASNSSTEPLEEISTLRGHRGPVRAVTFSPDRTIVASGGEEGGVRLRKLNGDKSPEVLIPHIHAGGVRLLALAPDNKVLASVGANREGIVRLWDLSNSRPKLKALLRLPFPSAESLAFSPHANVLAIGCASSVLLWDLNRLGRREDWALMGHTQAINSLAFAPNGQVLASGSQDGTVRLWSPPPCPPPRGGGGVGWGGPVAALEGSKTGVLSVAFAPDGQAVAAGDQDQNVVVWGLEESQPKKCLLRGHEAAVRLVEFLKDGRTLLSVDAKNWAYLWDLETKKKTRQWLLPGGATIVSVVGTGDGQVLAVGKIGFVSVLGLFPRAKEFAPLAV